MNNLLWSKCWLLEGVDKKTAEVYYRFTTKFNRPVVFAGLDIGATSYSKLVTGKQSSSSVIHTIFANEMTEQMYEDAVLMNGNSNEFMLGIPKDETSEVSILTKEQYAKALADSSSDDVFEQAQAQ